MSITTTYWREVYALRDRLFEEHGKSLWIASIKPPLGCETTAGAVSEANPLLSAQRIIEGTHTVATNEQIRAFLSKQEDNRSLIESMERRGSKRRAVLE